MCSSGLANSILSHQCPCTLGFNEMATRRLQLVRWFYRVIYLMKGLFEIDYMVQSLQGPNIHYTLVNS